MQIISPPVQRSYWYDRSSDDVSLKYSDSGVAPHSSTVRDTYTVPANKKAKICSYFLSERRSTIATVIGAVNAFIQVTPSGGSAYSLNSVVYVSNVTDTQIRDSGLVDLFLNAGDKVDLRTTDTSTGGTITFICFVGINEFDA